MIVFDTNVAASNATTQYLDFNFNSMVKFGHQFLCAGESGLYRLEGTSKISHVENGSFSEFTAYFEPVTMDFGISNAKRLRAVYIGYEADGDLSLKVSTELSAVQSYTLSATTDGQHARRVIISRSLKGRYWTFQFYGNGVKFSIDHVSVLPVVRGHGFDKN
jgi:hypothetical protein